MEKALEWLRRSPFDGGTEIEARQALKAEDFGRATPLSFRHRKSVYVHKEAPRG